MFEGIIGNNKMKRILSEIDNPSHAYMFIGPDGVGKFLFAKEFAYKWLCESDNRPCGKCKSCIQYLGNNNADLNIIEPEEGSVKVEQIRDMIKRIYEKPLESNKKIYIINDADKMTPAAQNALLKILEEPPHYIMIILIGSNEHQFLNTIKSRCIKTVFVKLNDEEMKEYLNKNNILFDEKFLGLYEGSIGKARRTEGFEENYIELEKWIRNAKDISKMDFMKKASTLITKENMEEMLRYLNILLFNFGKSNYFYLDAIEVTNKASRQCKYNCNTEMIIDNMALNIYEIIWQND